MTPVTFLVMAELVFGDKFVIDLDDVDVPENYFEFLGWHPEGHAMASSKRTEYVRGFETGFRKDTKAIKLSH